MEAILWFILIIPLYGVLIWTYFYPEESMIFGHRWKYREEPEFSDVAVSFTRFGAIVGIFFLTIVFVGVNFGQPITLLFVLAFIILVIYRLLKLRKHLLEDE
ncbi:hypothetical protein [Sutcliffiella rhizosphaerae]|uniref:DUF6199 domain-containing protein n=1 Tax=Sutcliffiella rhizosphaerae TaxID=2880967 RepID=A0ABN8A8P1_9BACI|nr:hypothetical protein [Sutcliffiella rhizosphaerae]CAG9621534.1 hypothetical protein BACCIP111883_02307 [Sutcliffiella rhizosphaerae]